MTRRIWPACFLFAALAGCQETDPNKINNNLPPSEPAKTGAAAPAPAPKKDAAGGGAMAKTGNAPSGGQQPPAPYKAPSGYPMPEGATHPGGADAAAKPADAPKPDTAAPTDTRKVVKLTADELEAIGKLPKAEMEIAMQQMVCPISGENLGSMGTPVKVELDGKVGFLCCKGCKDDYEKDPAAAFAKLEKK